MQFQEIKIRSCSEQNVFQKVLGTVAFAAPGSTPKNAWSWHSDGEQWLLSAEALAGRGMDRDSSDVGKSSEQSLQSYSTNRNLSNFVSNVCI